MLQTNLVVPLDNEKSKKIQDLDVGDRLFSYDLERRIVEATEVTSKRIVEKQKNNFLMNSTTIKDDYKVAFICSPEQYLLLDGKEWKYVGDLKRNMKIGSIIKFSRLGYVFKQTQNIQVSKTEIYEKQHFKKSILHKNKMASVKIRFVKKIEKSVDLVEIICEPHNHFFVSPTDSYLNYVLVKGC